MTNGPPSTTALAAAVAESPRPPLGKILVAAARHAVPLVPLYFFGGNTGAYLLLTAYDLCLGLLVIAALTPDATGTRTTPSKLPWFAGIPFLAPLFAIVAAFLTVPIGMPAFIMGLRAGVDWKAVVSRPSFWASVGVMVLLATARAVFGSEKQAALDESAAGREALERERAGAREAYAVQVTLIATFVLLSYLLIHFGRLMFFAIPPAYFALLVFYDVRPDLARRLLPSLWRGTGASDSPGTTPPLKRRRRGRRQGRR